MKRDVRLLPLLFLFVPVTAFQVSAESRLVIPRIVFRLGRVDGIVIVNPTAAVAELTFRAYNTDGKPLSGAGVSNPVHEKLAPGRQFSRSAVDLFNPPSSVAASAAPTYVWVEITSPTDGLSGMFLAGDATTGTLDSSDLVGAGTDLVIPVVDGPGGNATELALVNPNPSAASVALDFVRATGLIVATKRVEIPPLGALQGALPALFPLTSTDIATVRMKSDRPIVGFAFLTGDGASLSVVPAINGSVPARTLFFPDFKQGDDWTGLLGVVNLEPRSVLVTATAFQPDGTLMRAPGLSENPVTRAIPPSGSLRVTLDSLFKFAASPTASGWISVEASDVAINGYLEIGTSSMRTVAVAQLEALDKSLLAYQATAAPFSTALATLNTGNITANIELVSIAPDGRVVAKTQRVLQPRRRELLNLKEWLPTAAAISGGMVFLKSDVPLFTSEWLSTENSTALFHVPSQKPPASYDPSASTARATVFPPLAVVETCKTQRFNSSGVADPMWLVNGLPGGGGSTGSMTSGGVYTAPAKAPVGHSISIQAANAGSGQSAGASVDVVQRETLTTGLTLVTAIAYVENLQRFFIAEQQLLSAPQGPPASEAQAAGASTVISEQSANGTLTPVVVLFETVSKMLTYVDGNGTSWLLMAGADSGRIYRLNAGSRQLATIASGLQFPNSLALDPITGDLMVSEGGANRITVIPRTQFDGAATAAAAASAAEDISAGVVGGGLVLADPRGIAFDSCTGALYVSSADGKIREYLGDTERTVATGLDNPTQILVLHREAVYPCAAGTTLLVCEPTRVAQVIPQTGRVTTFLDGTIRVVDLVYLPLDNPFVADGEAAVAIADTSANVGRSRVLDVPVGQLYEERTPLQAQSVEPGGTELPFRDPLGDTFETVGTRRGGLQAQDLLSVGAHAAGNSVILTLTFARPVSPYAASLPNSLSGFIEFDIKPGGVRSRADSFNPLGQSNGLGIDASIDLSGSRLSLAGGAQPGAAAGRELAGSETPIDMFFLGNVMSLRIPTEVLDVSKAKIVALVGNALEITDLAPNQRFMGVRTDSGGVRTVGFTRSTGRGAESAVPMPVEVSLSSASAEEVRVSYSATGGTAVAGRDFILPSGILVFRAGQLLQTIPLAVLNSDLRQADRTVIITLSDPVNSLLGEIAEYTFTIQDDDPDPKVSFGRSSGGALEADRSESVELQLTNPTSFPVTVVCAATGGNARPGIDYRLPNPVVNFEPGETSRSLEIQLLDDRLPGPDRTLVLAMTSTTNAQLGSPSAFLYSIKEVTAPPLPAVAFDQSASFPEVGSTPQIPVSLSTASGNTVTVDYAVVGGTAQSGTDYLASSGTLTFNPGTTTQSVSLSIMQFATVFRTVVLQLSNPAGANLGANATHTLTIAPVLIQTAFFDQISSNQLPGTTAQVPVSLSTPRPATVTVDYAVAGGTAQAGADYIAASGTLSFSPGTTTLNVPLTILPSATPGLTIVLQLSNAIGVVLVSDTTHTITITAGPGPPVQLQDWGRR